MQQAVGKAASGSARIKAHKTGHIQPEVFKDGQKLVGAPAHVALRLQQGKDRVGGKRMPRLGNNLWRCAGNGLLKDDFASHDEAAGLLAAFGKALLKNQLVGALSG